MFVQVYVAQGRQSVHPTAEFTARTAVLCIKARSTQLLKAFPGSLICCKKKKKNTHTHEAYTATLTLLPRQ